MLIRGRAASVNPVDWKYRRGFMPRKLPTVLGTDVSGTVELSRAGRFEVGDEVFGIVQSGAYAELATAAATKIVRKPAGLSHGRRPRSRWRGSRRGRRCSTAAGSSAAERR